MNMFDNLYKEILLDEGKVSKWMASGAFGAGTILGSMLNNGVPPETHQYKSPPAKTQQMKSEPRGIWNATDEEVVKAALPAIKWNEGFRPDAYNDSVGKRTIGYGFNLEEPMIQNILRSYGYSPRKLDMSQEQLNKADADKILNDVVIKVALRDAKRFAPNWENLPFGVRKALLDMAYQLGYTKLSGFKKMRSAMLRYDLRTMADEMKKSRWYHQTPNRAKRNIAMVRSNATVMDRKMKQQKQGEIK